MLVPIPYDPEIHYIPLADLPLVEALRRESRRKDLIVFLDKEEGTWGVALDGRNGRMPQIAEITPLGTGAGEGPWCSPQVFLEVLEALASMRPTAELKYKMSQGKDARLRAHSDYCADIDDAKAETIHTMKSLGKNVEVERLTERGNLRPARWSTKREL